MYKTKKNVPITIGRDRTKLIGEVFPADDLIASIQANPQHYHIEIVREANNKTMEIVEWSICPNPPQTIQDSEFFQNRLFPVYENETIQTLEETRSGRTTLEMFGCSSLILASGITFFLIRAAFQLWR